MEKLAHDERAFDVALVESVFALTNEILALRADEVARSNSVARVDRKKSPAAARFDLHLGWVPKVLAARARIASFPIEEFSWNEQRKSENRGEIAAIGLRAFVAKAMQRLVEKTGGVDLVRFDLKNKISKDPARGWPHGKDGMFPGVFLGSFVTHSSIVFEPYTSGARTLEVPALRNIDQVFSYAVKLLASNRWRLVEHVGECPLIPRGERAHHLFLHYPLLPDGKLAKGRRSKFCCARHQSTFSKRFRRGDTSGENE